MAIAVNGISSSVASGSTNYTSEISKLQQEKIQYETDLKNATDDSEKDDIQQKINDIETEISNLKQKEKASDSDSSSDTTQAADVNKNTDASLESKTSTLKNVVNGSLEETSKDGDKASISRQGQLFYQNQNGDNNKSGNGGSNLYGTSGSADYYA